LDGESFADEIDGRAEAPSLEGGDPEQMQAVGMTGSHGEDPAVAMLGFGQSSGPMMLDGLGEQVLEACA
jgi:hypothetical protein